MIPKASIKSYAQHYEDIVLLALLHDVERGFYVDVGANHASIDSVTKLFYDRGWRGINIEPIRELQEQLVDRRPNDINLHCGVSRRPSKMDFYQNVSKPGHSSFKESEARGDSGDEVLVQKVKTNTLKSILSKHAAKHIHFLKIDVEGFEQEVIESNDWSVYRPEIICIESNHYSGTWRKKLVAEGYRRFISDGLNSYYIAKESWGRTEGYAERIVYLLHKTLKKHQFDAWTADSRQLRKVTKMNQIHYDIVQSIRHDKPDNTQKRRGFFLKPRSTK